MTFLFSTEGLILSGGILIIALLIFAETGLLLGLIIPGGETLVFTAGLLVSTGTLDLSITAMLLLLIAAGFAGDMSGYFIGNRYGRKLYNKKDTWYFRKRYLEMAEGFFKKHKRSSVIIGKFLPVIRPFTPLMSGISRMKLPFFSLLTLTAVILYMSSFLLSGYYLGKRFPVIKEYIGWILPISIVVVLIPVILQIRKANMRKKSAREKNNPAFIL